MKNELVKIKIRFDSPLLKEIDELRNELAKIKNEFNSPLIEEKEKIECEIRKCKSELIEIKKRNNFVDEVLRTRNEVKKIKDERRKILMDIKTLKDDEIRNLNSAKKQMCYASVPQYIIREYIPLVEKPIGREYQYIWHHIDPVLPYVVPCKKSIHEIFCGGYDKENHIHNVNAFLGIIRIDYTFMPGLFKQFEIE